MADDTRQAIRREKGEREREREEEEEKMKKRTIREEEH